MGDIPKRDHAQAIFFISSRLHFCPCTKTFFTKLIKHHEKKLSLVHYSAR